MSFGTVVSPGSGNSLAITPSKLTPSWSTTRTHTTGLPSSVFCHNPAADGSAAFAGGPASAVKASAAAKHAAIGHARRDLDMRDLDTAVRIIIHLTNA
jgi:hypothetical protein